MGEKWSSLERICLTLLQLKNTRASLLQIHTFMLRNALETNVSLLSKFVAASGLLGLTRHARIMFDKSPHTHRTDSFLCNSVIKAHTDSRQFAESLALYRDLRTDAGFVPDGFTFLVLVKSCAQNMALREGGEIHCHVIKHGFSSNSHVLAALVEMYAEFGRSSRDTSRSRKLFDETASRDAAVHNAMIAGYAKSGDMGSARDLFESMAAETRDVVTWTTVIHGYCLSGDADSARSLFDAMPESKSLAPWNAMIGGYRANGRPREALRLFRELEAEASPEPNEVTVVSVLPAIGDLGDLDSGLWVHRLVRRKRLDGAGKVRAALVDMYAKCGEVSRAKRVFDETGPEKKTASWNAMIRGLAMNGRGEEALGLFSEMLRKNLKPSGVTMLGVLTACDHGGLVEEGRRWFEAMEGLGVTPRIEHYGCMVGLLGRAGLLEEAERLIDDMPFEPNGTVLSSFLSSCVFFGDEARARRVLGEAVSLEPRNGGNYVAARNSYVAGLRWTEAEEVERLMKCNGARKEVGRSFVVEVGGAVSEFVCGNRSHPSWDRIDSTLAQLRNHMEGDIHSFIFGRSLFFT